MRLFKSHRAQTSQTDLADDSLRGQSPDRPFAYYPQDNSRASDVTAAASSSQSSIRQIPSRSVDIFDALKFSRSTVPSDPVPTDNALPGLNSQSPSSVQLNQLEETESQGSSPSADDKESKQSRRSYLGSQSGPSNTSRTLGRSASVRKRQTPPSLDITPSRYNQQSHSAIEGPRSANLNFPRSPPLSRGAVSNSEDSQGHLQGPTFQERNRSHSSLQHSGEIIERGVKEPPSRGSPESGPDEPIDTKRSNFVAYHPLRPGEQQISQTYEAYRVRPESQQSTGPPSPLASQSRLVRVDPPSQASSSLHSHRQETMARDGQSSNNTRHTGQPSHGHSHEQGQHSQFLAAAGQRRPSLAHQMSGTSENGRSTPPPNSSKSREDLSNIDLVAFVQKHEELQAKYSKVKKYYFEKDAQVQQLQNIVAHQRLSMSNTALDDNEYQNRFTRLEGSINNFAYNIRKEWKAVPPWLQPFMNKDAASPPSTTSKNKEMTQLGRACITRWLVDEIFDRFFHPSLEPTLSSQLKIIEKNLRRNLQSQVTTEAAQRDDHAAKLSNWRLTTIEGLQDILSSSQAYEYRTQLTSALVTKLTAALEMSLSEPPPPDLQASVGGIIELAISIAVSLPLESRDICIEYPMPGDPINESLMRIETGIPPLTNPDGNNDLFASNSGEPMEETGSNGPSVEPMLDRESIMGTGRERDLGTSSQRFDPKKRSIFGGLGNKKPGPGEMNMGSIGQGPLVPGSTSEREGPKERESGESPSTAVDRGKRIRLACFVVVEVKGKGKEGSNVLIKAPCFAL